jgi:hypothetical protein
MTYMYTHTQIYTQCIFANIYIQTLLVQYSTGQGSTGQDTRGQGSSRVQYCTGHHLTLRYATLHDAALPDAMRRYATLILPRYIHPSMHRYIHTYISISINLNLNLNININITLHYTALIISHSLALHCIVFHYHYITLTYHYITIITLYFTATHTYTIPINTRCFSILGWSLLTHIFLAVPLWDRSLCLVIAIFQNYRHFAISLLLPGWVKDGFVQLN